MNKKFTLIELLMVVVIIGILVSILAPSLAKARYNATNAICVSNLAQKARATFLFCQDNNNKYPDRGIDSAGRVQMYYRFASLNDLVGDETLLNTIGDYDAISNPTWVCPLYQGTGVSYMYKGKECTVAGLYGCLDHGAAHISKTVEVGPSHGQLTYSLHAGIGEKMDTGVGGILFSKGRGRRVLGDAYQVDWNGIELNSRVLWSDSATGDNSTFAFQRPGNRLRTNHAPPPGVAWESPNKGYGILNVYGWTITNYSFDDGSAKALKTPNTTYTSTDELISIGSGGAYLIPK
jgi:prepilin-type N-terminal cleavage/methylation domain-containing protein